MGCFTQHDTPVGICPACGYNEAAAELSPHQLRPRTILSGKYLVGKMFGQGGFGITYAGWDMNLNIKVAIKEFYPTGFVTRETTSTNTVQPFTGSQGDFFRTGREKFMGEAQTLAKFRNLPGIVAVNDFFLENSTAYIVMEFIEGQTMKEYLAQMGGRLPADQVFLMMKPVMDSLGEVHAEGIIHRDISPDNIMISKKGNMKLLDFGAAREFADSGNKSMSILLKPGYAPEEQYRSKGLQGPWTDIYALCASMYKCMTGVTPEDSNERVRADDVKPPSALGIAINPVHEAALMKGMAVLTEHRFQNIETLRNAINNEQLTTNNNIPPPPVTVAHPTPTPVAPVYTGVPSQPAKKSKTALIASIIGGVCVAAIAVVLLIWQPWDSGGGYSSDSSRRSSRDAVETPDVEDVTEIADDFAKKLNRGILERLYLDNDDLKITHNDKGYITKIVTPWDDTYDFEYDFDARKIMGTSFRYDGEYSIVFIYNTDGYILSRADYDSDGNENSFSEYDLNGNRTRSRFWYKVDDGYEYTYEYTYEYDTDGNVVKQISWEDGRMLWAEESRYDTSGNQVWSYYKYYDADGSVNWVSEHQYRYDSNGNRVSEISWDDGVISGTTEHTYDRNGNRSKSTRYDANGRVTDWTEFEYELVNDEWGEWWRLARATGYDADGNVDWTRDDENGYWYNEEDYYEWEHPEEGYDDPWGWDEWDEWDGDDWDWDLDW